MSLDFFKPCIAIFERQLEIGKHCYAVEDQPPNSFRFWMFRCIPEVLRCVSGDFRVFLGASGGFRDFHVRSMGFRGRSMRLEAFHNFPYI